MKTTILKITVFALLFSLVGAGCEKEKTDYDTDSIIGKWKWVESWYHGITSFKIYPDKNQEKILEFTDDSILIFKENGKTVYSEKAEIVNETLFFYDISEVRQENTIEIRNDTLILKNIGGSFQISYPFLSIYKRIN